MENAAEQARREACIEQVREVLDDYCFTIGDAGWVLCRIIMADVIDRIPENMRSGFINDLADIMRMTSSGMATPRQ